MKVIIALLLIALSTLVSAKICQVNDTFSDPVYPICGNNVTGMAHVSKLLKSVKQPDDCPLELCVYNYKKVHPFEICKQSYVAEVDWLDPPHEWAFDIKCTVGNVRSSICEKNHRNDTLGLKYNGTERFCNNSNEYSNHTVNCTNTSPLCYCEMGDIINTCWAFFTHEELLEGLQVNLFLDTSFTLLIDQHNHGTFWNLSLVSYLDMWDNLTLVPRSTITNRKRGVAELAIQTNTEEVFCRFEDHVLIIQFTSLLPHHVVVRKELYADLFETEDRIFHATIPDAVFMNSGTFYITVYQNSSTVFMEQIEITGERICRFHDCLFCSDAFENWDCLSSTYKAAVILFLLMMGFVLVLLLPGLVYTLVWITKCFIIKPIRMVVRGTWNIGKSPFARKTKQKAKEASEYFFTEEREPATELTNRSSKPVRMMALLMIVSLASACEDGLFIPATFTNCIKGTGNTETCDVLFSLTATIQYPTAKTCFIIADESNKTLLNGYISYDYMLERVDLVQQYYTAAWSGKSESVFRCYLAGHCNDGECALINSNQIRNAQGELDDGEVIHYPGSVRCARRGGGVSDGCFYSNNACVFTGAAIIPEGDIYAVLKPTTRHRIPSATFSVSSQGNVIASQTVAIDGSSATITANDKTFKLKIIGSLHGTSADFTGLSVVTTGLVTKLGEAALVNEPVAGFFGDIQSNSKCFNCDGVSSFKIADNLYTYSDSGQYDIVTFKQAGSHNFDTMKTFPVVIGGDLWLSRSGYIESNVTEPGALVINLESTGNITITRVLNVVCPQATFVTASGCFNCTMGATVVITAKSVCHDGNAQLTIDDPNIDLQTNHIELELEDSNFTIRLFTVDDDNDFDLNIHGTDKVFVVHVSFKAYADPLVIVNNQTTFSALTGPGSSDSPNSFVNFFKNTIPGFFDDIFNGVASWWEYLLFGLFIIACLFVVFTLVVPTVKMLGRFVSRMGYKKIPSNQKDIYKQS